VAELIPAPFGALLNRLLHEHEREGKVYDLPARKFWRGSADLDTAVAFHGRRAGNPVGPAAGPQDQMAQNILLAWLAGSRILELKTVQINDRLAIPRPCIDATNVGYNVEWSQELRLAESLDEYVKGSMLVDIAREADVLGRAAPSDKDDTIFDMSVGYDLEGIRSAAVRAWIEAMKDARAHVDRFRAEFPAAHRRWRDLDFRTRLSGQVTLSTFHGCPAGEIEGIVRFLLTEMAVDVTVKLNPTLLGRAAVDALLHDVLGYAEVETRQEDFDKDLQWEQALEITDRLGEVARAEGRTFQVKFSNTLVVRNHRDFFPASEQVMYLSGAPLHVITLHLVERYRRARPEVPISFSAGVDNQNFPDCVAMGFTPITTCTDLLRPGGYARLPAYLDRLEERMRAVGATDVGEFVLKAHGQGEEAARRRPGAAPAELVAEAGRLNTPLVVARANADPRYKAEANRATPRKIGSRLWLFDCINCDKCVPVCPNDANFTYETGVLRMEYRHYRVADGRVGEAPGGVFEVRKAHQIANFQDFCNECGNCDTFCPEDGGPFVEKPRFFGSLEAWERLRPLDGFYCRRADGVDAAWGRIRGHEYHLEVDRALDRALFTDGVVRLAVRHSERKPLEASAPADAAEGHTLDFAAYLNMALAVDGVLDARQANPVNAAWL
jgi:putative selenate reductase